MYWCKCRYLPLVPFFAGAAVLCEAHFDDQFIYAVYCHCGGSAVIRRLFFNYRLSPILHAGIYPNGTPATDGTFQARKVGAQGAREKQILIARARDDVLLDVLTSLGEAVRMSKVMDQIRQAIQAGEKSRYRIAKETGIDQSALSRFMSGERGLPVDKLELVAECIGLEIIVREKGGK